MSSIYTSASSMPDKTLSMMDCVISGEHLSPIGSRVYLYLPNGVIIIEALTFLVKLKGVVLHTDIQSGKKPIPGTLAQDI